ncbi:MAG: tyrosine-type recombinase/integrase, partial [Planctomycetes bacterium]|nr:tyrosine-type recombinase/integrase [Planctomycetota bacterium]
TEPEAKAWLDLKRRKGLGPVRNVRAPLHEALDEWLAELEIRGRSANTLREYRFLVSAWKAHFGDRAVSGITQDDVLELLSQRSKIRAAGGKTRKASARTMNLTLVLLRSFFRWAVRKGSCEADPTAGLDRWKEPKREPRVLSPEEVQRLLRASREPYGLTIGRLEHRPYEASQTFTPPENLYPIVLCALTTCMRYSNVVNLRWEQIDFERGEIRLSAEEVKTRSELAVPISRALKDCLLSLPKGSPQDRVFGAARGVARSFRSALRRAGIKGASFHALRRTGATHLLQHGIPREVVERLGGWRASGGVMIEHYRAVNMEELRRAVEVLDRLVSGSTAGAKATAETSS